MKKFFVLAVVVLSFFAFSGQAEAQSCTPTGLNCPGYFSQAGQEYILTDPINYPGCEVKIMYDYMICDDVTYFKLTGVGWTQSTECNAAFNWFCPNGWGAYADQQRLAQAWETAFGGICLEWFEDMLAQNPGSHKCPNGYTFRTITDGGCTSWTYAKRPENETQTEILFHFLPVPCVEDGCCIMEKTLCYNEDTQTIEESIVTTQIVTNSDNCTTEEPLYDPFENYGSEWIRSNVYSPCWASCYIWD